MNVNIYFANKNETIIIELPRNKTMDAGYFKNLTLLIDALCAGHFCYHLYREYRDDLISLLNSQISGETIRIELTRDGINILS